MRYPFAPLEAVARGHRPLHHSRCRCLIEHERDLGVCATAGYIGEQLGLSANQVQWLRKRGVTEDQADTLAVRLGRHPAEIWSDWTTNREEAA